MITPTYNCWLDVHTTVQTGSCMVAAEMILHGRQGFCAGVVIAWTVWASLS